MKKKILAVLTGAGISAESGLQTFRGSGGMWGEYDINVVASVEGWQKDPELVQEFYNIRRAELSKVEPNAAHKILAELETDFDVRIITQNVDDLHERAGSSKVIHLHGELTKARSSRDPDKVYDIGYRPIGKNEKAEDGSRLRPFVVWFGEAVPMIEYAIATIEIADIVVVIGTSLNVYPAAGLINYAPHYVPVWLIDPNDVLYTGKVNIKFIRETATAGMEKLRQILLEA